MIILDYAKIEDYYDRGFWTKQMVHDAVLKGKITAEEYKLITGEDYIA
jgi:uncharacterized XkdX family phage protein